MVQLVSEEQTENRSRNGKRQIWFKICGQTKRYDFHVVDVTKPIPSVSCLCENEVETHLAKASLLRFGDGHEPLIRRGGVYFVKTQTVNACVRADGCTEKTREYNLMGDQKIDAYELMDSQKTDAYKLMDSQKKTDAYELMDSQKIDEYEMTGEQKIDEYEMTGAQKKTHAYKLMDSQKTREYNLKSAQKTDEYEIIGALNPCVQTKKVKNPCVKNSSCVGVRKKDGVDIIHNCQRKRACQDADVKPVVRDPMDDDRILVESRAEMTPVPHEPSEFEKQKHNLTHIPFRPWCTSCVKGKAQAEPHKRTERITEDSELPVIQCDYLMLKDVAGTGGLKVLSMYVRTFGYGMSTVVETKSPTDMFATMWSVKMLNFLGLSDIILQCDPEPPLIKWAQSVKSKRTERTVIRSSPRRSHQSNGGVENYQKQLQGQVQTMLAAMQEHTHNTDHLQTTH